tara:strand:+ start:132 stop:458 length:327 start_codon:yes stop_codon:yes gene_type:complete
MNIHYLWFLCIIVRLSLIKIIRYMKKESRQIMTFILLIMGLGFIYKGYFGSNNEIQIAKVFWHETRIIHGMFYILASYYLFNNNLDMNSLILLSDIIFSIMYRIFTNQ